MRRLVCEYYDGFSFGRFIKEYPHLRDKSPICSSATYSTTRLTRSGGHSSRFTRRRSRLFPPGTRGSSRKTCPDKVNELYLPSGELR